jgi:biopolymer transport protein ExbD
MGIKIQCPSCKKIRAVNERLLGREINCPDCGKPIQVPSKEKIELARRAKEEERKLTEQLEKQFAAFSASGASTARVPQTSSYSAANDHNTNPVEDVPAEEFERTKSIAVGDDMDMTPMVDVTFLLLIFFMITASFSIQKSIQRPAQNNDQASSRPVEAEDKDNPDIVRVQVDEFNAYNIVTSDWDRPAASKQDLIVALNEAHAGDSSGNVPTKLIVEAHEDCLHAAVIGALDAGREAKFESFEVTTVEQFD